MPSAGLRHHSRVRGFTIVEVMMASVILVVGFMGMITAITIGSEMLATARRQTLAAEIITTEINKLRLSSWANTPAAGGPTTLAISSHFTPAINSCGLATSAISLQRTITDLDVDADGAVDFKDVTFVVNWTQRGTDTAASAPSGSWLQRLAFYRPSSSSRTYTRSMSTMIGKYGLNLSFQQ